MQVRRRRTTTPQKGWAEAALGRKRTRVEDKSADKAPLARTKMLKTSVLPSRNSGGVNSYSKNACQSISTRKSGSGKAATM
jgi:hypothetical protein